MEEELIDAFGCQGRLLFKKQWTEYSTDDTVLWDHSLEVLLSWWNLASTSLTLPRLMAGQ